MTCGESRFVFTVINALCNSLKTIKEAEVFPFLFFFCGSDTHFCCSCTHQCWTVAGISGSQFTQYKRWLEMYAWNIIVSGGSGAASSNLAATNSNLSANISLLLTSVRWIVIGDIRSSKSLLTSPIACSNTHLFFIINFLVGCFVSPDDISQLLI